MRTKENHSEEALPQLKATTFPDQNVLRQRLIDAGLYRKDRQTDRFYDRFTGFLAEHELVGEGVSLNWDMANWYAESMEGDRWDPNHPNYDTVIDVLIDDPEVASQAKEIRESMLEGRIPKEYDRSQLESSYAEKIEAERVERARLTAEKERQAALQIRKTATKILKSGPINEPDFTLSKGNDGSIDASIQRSWTFDDENYKEWIDFVRVKPDNTIEVGYVDITWSAKPENLPSMKPFSMEDIDTTDILLRVMARRLQQPE